MRISVLTCLALLLWECGPTSSPVVNGDPSRGAAAVYRYGCGSCHSIVHIANAHGLVGPPLDNIRDRMYIAGMLENNPTNMQRWIRNPKSVNPRTAMPNLGVSAQDAADIAALLYSH